MQWLRAIRSLTARDWAETLGIGLAAGALAYAAVKFYESRKEEQGQPTAAVAPAEAAAPAATPSYAAVPGWTRNSSIPVGDSSGESAGAGNSNGSWESGNWVSQPEPAPAGTWSSKWEPPRSSTPSTWATQSTSAMPSLWANAAQAPATAPQRPVFAHQFSELRLAELLSSQSDRGFGISYIKGVVETAILRSPKATKRQTVCPVGFVTTPHFEAAVQEYLASSSSTKTDASSGAAAVLTATQAKWPCREVFTDYYPFMTTDTLLSFLRSDVADMRLSAFHYIAGVYDSFATRPRAVRCSTEKLLPGELAMLFEEQAQRQDVPPSVPAIETIADAFEGRAICGFAE